MGCIYRMTLGVINVWGQICAVVHTRIVEILNVAASKLEGEGAHVKYVVN